MEGESAVRLEENAQGQRIGALLCTCSYVHLYISLLNQRTGASPALSSKKKIARNSYFGPADGPR